MDKYNQINNILKKLKSKKVDKETLIGFIVTILLDKNIFSTNHEVNKFIWLSLKIVMPQYAIRSRTLMIAKVCKHLISMPETDIEYLKSVLYVNLIMVLSEQTSIEWHFDDHVKPVKNDALRNMNKWIGGILKKDK